MAPPRQHMSGDGTAGAICPAEDLGQAACPGNWPERDGLAKDAQFGIGHQGNSKLFWVQRWAPRAKFRDALASGISPRASSAENIQRCKHDDFIQVRVSGDTCAGDGSPSNRGNSDPGGSDTTMWRPPSPASPLA